MMLSLGGVMVRAAVGQTSAPSPVTVSRGAFPVTVAAGEYSLMSVVANLPPGSGVPWHTHSGAVIGTVISGEATLLSREGGQQTFKTGQSWIESRMRWVNSSTGAPATPTSWRPT